MARYAVIFDREATDDLASIRDHIAPLRGLDFANAFIDRIIAFCESFAHLPHRGAKRDAIRAGLRTVGWRKTVTIAFEVSDEAERVAILGVFYRGRDVLTALGERAEKN